MLSWQRKNFHRRCSSSSESRVRRAASWARRREWRNSHPSSVRRSPRKLLRLARRSGPGNRSRRGDGSMAAPLLGRLPAVGPGPGSGGQRSRHQPGRKGGCGKRKVETPCDGFIARGFGSPEKPGGCPEVEYPAHRRNSDPLFRLSGLPACNLPTDRIDL